jgi:hypothetical protein
MFTRQDAEIVRAVASSFLPGSVTSNRLYEIAEKIDGALPSSVPPVFGRGGKVDARVAGLPPG